MPKIKGQSTHNRFNREQARVEAEAQGRELYWSEVVCVKGHVTSGKTLRRINDYKCHECRLATQKSYKRDKDKDAIRRATPEYRAAATARARRWAENNRERYRALQQEREAAYRTHCPPWVDRKAIVDFYEKRPPDHHVDHIIPLRGVVIDGGNKWRVSGLHAMHNLQYLDGPSNRAKNNKCFQIE